MIVYEDLAVVNRPFLKEYHDCLDRFIHDNRFVLGENVSAFESEFASYCGVSFGVGVGNGLEALTLILKSFNFPAGAEVIVPANTHFATILSVLNAGLKPRLVDVASKTGNLDPSLVSQSVSANTVAMVPVHMYGTCAPMPELVEIAKARGLRVIEDCAQAHGASLRGLKAGAWGDAAAFSFYPTKNLGALGDGGMVVTNDGGIADRVRSMRNYGSREKNVHVEIGMNSRLDELQAVFLRIKFKALDQMNSVRRHFAAIYDAGLRREFLRPVRDAGRFDVFHIYAIRHPRRDELKDYLARRGVSTMVHYPTAPHKQPALLQVIGQLQFPVTENIHATTLSLPVSTAHSQQQIEEVVNIMNRFD